MRQQQASHKLEELTIQANETVSLLRDQSTSRDLSYALVYELRTRLGRIVADLGVSLPRTSALATARQLLDEQTSTSTSTSVK